MSTKRPYVRATRSRSNSLPSEEMAAKNNPLLTKDIENLRELVELHGNATQETSFNNLMNHIEQSFAEQAKLIQGLRRETDDLTEMVQTLAKSHKLLKDELRQSKHDRLKIEIEQCKSQVIIKNLPFNTGCSNGKEPPQKTREKLINTFEKMGMELAKIEIQDCQRFIAKRELETGKFPMIKVTFASNAAKAELFKILSTYKPGPDDPKLNVEDSIPKDMQARKRTLEDKAYALREADQNVRTRIMIIKSTLVLATKLKGEKKFIALEDNEMEVMEVDQTETISPAAKKQKGNKGGQK